MNQSRGSSAAVRIAMTQMTGDLLAMYAQGGLTGVLMGMIVGIITYQLRSRGVMLRGGLKLL